MSYSWCVAGAGPDPGFLTLGQAVFSPRFLFSLAPARLQHSLGNSSSIYNGHLIMLKWYSEERSVGTCALPQICTKCAEASGKIKPCQEKNVLWQFHHWLLFPTLLPALNLWPWWTTLSTLSSLPCCLPWVLKYAFSQWCACPARIPDLLLPFKLPHSLLILSGLQRHGTQPQQLLLFLL